MISCIHPKRAIVEYTAIIGASNIASGVLILSREYTFSYRLNLWFLVYCTALLLLSAFGIFFQRALNYHKLADKEDEHYAHHALLPHHHGHTQQQVQTVNVVYNQLPAYGANQSYVQPYQPYQPPVVYGQQMYDPVYLPQP